MYYVYIIQSKKDSSFYIGYTGNLDKRVNDHNLGKSTYTKTKTPWELVYYETFEIKLEAIKRERFLKKQKNKEFYQKLIRFGSSAG
ncbi:MAG TPA: GIY-YIG nuclease family protein [Flavobacteriaceae bacterium]